MTDPAAITVRQILERANTHFTAGDFSAACVHFGAAISSQPQLLDARLRVADCLLAMGEVQRAATVYTLLARHASNAGHPLRALVAIKILTALEPQLERMIEPVSDLYSSDSKRLGTAVRVGLGNPDAIPAAGWQSMVNGPSDVLVKQAEQLASRYDTVAHYPEKLPAIPLLSELPAKAFLEAVRAVTLLRKRAGDAVFNEGDRGESFFVIARGRVGISKQASNKQPATRVASLGDGSLFGEIALLANTPRTATVTADVDSDLLEFDRGALLAASDNMPTMAARLDHFARSRLLDNLFSSAAFFKPLTPEQRVGLGRHFRAFDVAAGTALVKEGQRGEGLFILLRGEADVWKVEGNEKVYLAMLRAGDIFGEISLLYDRPATATVSAASDGTVLFLDRAHFKRLIDALPALKSYVEGLGDERLLDTRLTLDPGGDS